MLPDVARLSTSRSNVDGFPIGRVPNASNTNGSWVVVNTGPGPKTPNRLSLCDISETPPETVIPRVKTKLASGVSVNPSALNFAPLTRIEYGPVRPTPCPSQFERASVAPGPSGDRSVVEGSSSHILPAELLGS